MKKILPFTLYLVFTGAYCPAQNDIARLGAYAPQASTVYSNALAGRHSGAYAERHSNTNAGYHTNAYTSQALSTAIRRDTAISGPIPTVKNNKARLADASLPEPRGWYTGDIHVHRNCGDGTIVLPYDTLAFMMRKNNLSVISLLADMGNGEVKDSETDLKKVNGKDSPLSEPGRIIHWDAEWHWDATYSNFSHQALGGHLVLLGLKNARQIWDESPYHILDWARKQKAVSGICHMQYLNDEIQNELNCCIPIDYPVEAAMGTIDFVAEDVYGGHSPNNGTYNSEAAINAYYKLLNCGFRIGLAAGTDYPCNDYEPLGTLLTYVKVKNKLTYRKWIEGIKKGKTVVSRNAHNEFMALKVNGKYEPGDDLKIKNNSTVSIEAVWTSTEPLTGRIELVSNGKIIAVQEGNASPGAPLTLTATQAFDQSGWICARRMNENGRQTHTAPVFITVNKKPVRASADDARYFIAWIDNILKNIAPGESWSRYFTKEPETVRQRYLAARNIYQQILDETEAAR